jgi:thiol:disulfide interchange protein DsbD
MGNKLHRHVARMLIVISMLLIGQWSQSAYAVDDFLPPEVAFKFSARMVDAKNIEVKYLIADGYYMYRERFRFRADGAKLGDPTFPKGKVKFDETFQKNVETFRHSVIIKVPVEANAPFTLISTGQGCADQGLCYAPMDSEAKLTIGSNNKLSLSSFSAVDESSMKVKNSQLSSVNAAVEDNSNPINVSSIQNSELTGDKNISNALGSGKLTSLLIPFFLAGLGISFLPCVYPLVGILLRIIVGEGTHVTKRRGFVLAGVYSLGMALVYTCMGIAAGLAREGLAASLQNVWVLSVSATLMVILSLSMLGAYAIQVPASMQSALLKISERQKSGKLLNVFVMGVISALVIGPCVAPPLAAALIYLGQTQDVFIGGSALFIMAVGMSVPLLIAGVSAGALLPLAGPWMEDVKKFFGVLMLGMAIWIVSPVLSIDVQMIGWAVLGLGYSGYLLSSKNGSWLAKLLGVVFAIVGLAELVGVSTGGQDVFAPLAHLSKDGIKKTEFVRVKSVAELDAAIGQAQGKYVMLDFYADWCVSCKEMEKLTFVNPAVRPKMASMLLLQADVTTNNADDKELLKRFQLFGPPGIIFFDKQGREIEGGRVIGYQNAEKFAQSLSWVMQH